MFKKSQILFVLFVFLFSSWIYSEDVNLKEIADKARWTNGGNVLLQFGKDLGKDGTVKHLIQPTLENGKKHEKVIFTHPPWVENGMVAGKYENITIPTKNPMAIIAGGFLDGAKGTDGVKFAMNFLVASATPDPGKRIPSRSSTGSTGRIPTSTYGVELCSFNATYDEIIDRVECDLSKYAGQKGTIFLIVTAGKSSEKDWAIWTTARIETVEKKATKKKTGQKDKPEPKKKKIEKPKPKPKPFKPSAKELKNFSGHNNRIYRLDFSPNGKYLVSGSGDNTARIWEVPKGGIKSTLKGHSSHVFWVGFRSNNKHVVTAAGNAARIWDMNNGSVVKALGAHAKRVLAADFSPDGGTVATSSEDGVVKLWQVGNGQEIRSITAGKGAIYSLCFSPKGNTFATGGYTGETCLWNISNGNKIRTYTGHNRAISTLTFSENGKYLLSASVDNTVKIWEVSSGKTIKTLRGYTFRSAHFSPDGKYVVTGNDNGQARIWEVSSGKEILTIKHASSGLVMAARFSPNGKYVATGGEDNNVRIWAVELTKTAKIEEAKKK